MSLMVCLRWESHARLRDRGCSRLVSSSLLLEQEVQLLAGPMARGRGRFVFRLGFASSSSAAAGGEAARSLTPPARALPPAWVIKALPWQAQAHARGYFSAISYTKGGAWSKSPVLSPKTPLHTPNPQLSPLKQTSRSSSR